MKVAVQPTGPGAPQGTVPPAYVLRERPFILTCLTCGPSAAFAKADTLDEADKAARSHADLTKHPLHMIYFDRAWGYART